MIIQNSRTSSNRRDEAHNNGATRFRTLEEVVLENIDDFKRLSEAEAEYRRFDKGPIPLFNVERPEYRDGLVEAPLGVG